MSAAAVVFFFPVILDVVVAMTTYGNANEFLEKVYVRCSLPTLWSHIRLRRRPEEAKLDPEFVSRLQQCHEDWLVHNNSTLGPPPARVLVLDGNMAKGDFVKMVERRQAEILGYE